MSTGPAPRVWTDAELLRDLTQSATDFIADRNVDTTYDTFMPEAIAKVTRLMDQTDDLTTLAGGAALLANPLLVTPLRALAGPAISESDFATRSGVSGRLTTAKAEAAAAFLLGRLSRFLAPWMFETPIRRPTEAERSSAIKSGANVIANQMTATAQRKIAGRSQEASVHALLESEGYTKVTPRDVLTLQPGEFCGEVRVDTKKSDVTVCKWNGDLTFIECKVTNSGVNSVKRLADCLDKHTVWAAWGIENGRTIQTAAMLSGVINMVTLNGAQDRGLFLFWDHDLLPLANFVAK